MAFTNVLRDKKVRFLFQNLHIFADDFIADAKNVLAVTESLPSRTIRTAFGNHPKETIGVENNALHIQ